jgi:hypothetical protein
MSASAIALRKNRIIFAGIAAVPVVAHREPMQMRTILAPVSTAAASERAALADDSSKAAGTSSARIVSISAPIYCAEVRESTRFA